MAKTNKSPFKVIMIITLIVIGLISALVIISNSGAESGTSYEEQPPIENQPTLGDENAPVSVVEFGDFKCPSCKAWSEEVYPQLVEDYVNNGEVSFSHINVLFHGRESVLASLAAESVYQQNPDVYWDFHKEIYNQQPAAHDTEWVTVDKMVEVANEVGGIDTDQLRTDIEEETVAEQVNRDDQLVQEFNVELTPSIMVNDTMVEDPFDYEAITALIEAELEEN